MRIHLIFYTMILFVLFFSPSIIAYAASSVTDSYNDSSKVSGTYQTIVSGGKVQIDTYEEESNLVGFGSCRKITIDYTKIDANLTDFPILVYLNSSNIDWGKVQDDLDDLRFTQDNSTLLMAELDNFVVNSEAWIWVKIPSVSNLTNTELFMFYNNPSASSYWNPTLVWDSNFVMVHHMRYAQALVDSTSNNNDGTKSGTNEPTEVLTGQIDNAQDFDGNDYVDIPHSTSLNLGDVGESYTISFWMKSNYIGAGEQDTISKLKPSENYEYPFSFSFQNNYTVFHIRDQNGVENIATGNDIVSDDTWHYVVGVRDIISDKIYIYLDDGDAITGDDTTTVSCQNTVSLQLGNDHRGNYYVGLEDEVRISNISRSTAWIKAEYYTDTKQLQTYSSECIPELVYYSNGLVYSTNLLNNKNATEIQSFTYDSTIAAPATIKIQFSQNNATWYNQYGVANTWTTLSNGVNTIDLYGLNWKGNFFYRVNMTQTSSSESPSLNIISINYSSATQAASLLAATILMIVITIPILILVIMRRRR